MGGYYTHHTPHMDMGKEELFNQDIIVMILIAQRSYFNAVNIFNTVMQVI